MINYTEKGAGLHDAIHRAGHWLRQENGAWLSSDDAAVQAIIDGYDPVITSRADLSATIKVERERRQQAGLSYLFPDGATGTIQTRDEQDLLNINGQVTAALVLSAQGYTAPMLAFRDSENVTHAMTPAQMIAMGMAASQFVSATYAAKWAHDEAIKQWDGIAAYNVATGWP
jgi:hypothetical protein